MDIRKKRSLLAICLHLKITGICELFLELSIFSSLLIHMSVDPIVDHWYNQYSWKFWEFCIIKLSSPCPVLHDIFGQDVSINTCNSSARMVIQLLILLLFKFIAYMWIFSKLVYKIVSLTLISFICQYCTGCNLILWLLSVLSWLTHHILLNICQIMMVYV